METKWIKALCGLSVVAAVSLFSLGCDNSKPAADEAPASEYTEQEMKDMESGMGGGSGTTEPEDAKTE